MSQSDTPGLRRSPRLRERPPSSSTAAGAPSPGRPAKRGREAITPKDLAVCPHTSSVRTGAVLEAIEAPWKWNCDKRGCHRHGDIWVCLGCGYRGCCRDQKGAHALSHYSGSASKSEHCLAMSLCDTSVWCYACNDWVMNDDAEQSIGVLRSRLQALQRGSEFSALSSEIPGLTSSEEAQVAIADLEFAAERHHSMTVLRKCFLHWAFARGPKVLATPTRKTRQATKTFSVSLSASAREATLTPCASAPGPLGSLSRCGLRNLGNTCFLNSTIQALLAASPLRDAITSITPIHISSATLVSLPASTAQSLAEAAAKAVRDIHPEEASRLHGPIAVRLSLQPSHAGLHSPRPSVSADARPVVALLSKTQEGGRPYAALRVQSLVRQASADLLHEMEHAQPPPGVPAAPIQKRARAKSISSEANDHAAVARIVKMDSSASEETSFKLGPLAEALQGTQTTDRLSLVLELHHLARIMISGKRPMLSPLRFLYAVWSFLPKAFHAWEQQDVQEFVQSLLSRCHEDLASGGMLLPSTEGARVHAAAESLPEGDDPDPSIALAEPTVAAIVLPSGATSSSRARSPGLAGGALTAIPSSTPAVSKIPLNVSKGPRLPLLVPSNAVGDTVFGSTVTVVTCAHCKHQSSREESFSVLSLGIPEHMRPTTLPPRYKRAKAAEDKAAELHECLRDPVLRKLTAALGETKDEATRGVKGERITLSHLLQDFSKREILENDSAYQCDACGGRRTAVMRSFIKALPPVLIVHINRARWLMGGSKEKLQDHVDCPLSDLDLSQHGCLALDSTPRDRIRHETSSSVPSASRVRYDACSVIEHKGRGIDRGHYLAYAKEAASQEWISYDDAIVKVSSEEAVEAAQAYVMVYVRRCID
jgi:ubiquitin C-terminal hydrolase